MMRGSTTLLAMAAMLGAMPTGATFPVRYDAPPLDPKERERREEEENRRLMKRAARMTYHERLMEKQRAEIARIEKMRAEEAK